MSVYGLMAEYRTAEALKEAAGRVAERGYRRLDAYTPFPVEGLSKLIGMERNWVPFIVLVCGLLGAFCGFLLQYWIQAIDYPINVGGRPLNSWPAYMLVSFELAVLFGTLGAFFGMLALNGLPRVYHPVFNNPRFNAVSRDRFFLLIKASDPIFDLAATRHFLDGTDAVEVVEVPE